MGADMQDIGLTIHPHPTLSETLCFAAEMAEGTITDLMPPKKKIVILFKWNPRLLVVSRFFIYFYILKPKNSCIKSGLSLALEAMELVDFLFTIVPNLLQSFLRDFGSRMYILS